MLLRWGLTDRAYLALSRSYLCASLLWSTVEAINIAADLLAPIDSRFRDPGKDRRFVTY